MGWAKFDDQFTDHPKVQAAGPMAELLAMRAVVYCARYETDGLIRESVLPRLTVGITSPKRQISALIREGLWEETDGGWLVHDFLDYHPSRAEKDQERQAARERMANVRANKGRTKPEVRGEQQANTDRSSGYPVPSRPVPIQPLPTVEVTDEPLVLDEERSDPETGLEVWADSDGKQRQRIDGLWDAACEIWGTPKTDKEHGRRNKEIKELRKARVHPEMLRPLVAKAAGRWNNRPQLNGIITNLGDLLEGVEISPTDIKRYQAEVRRLARRKEITG